MASVGQMDEKIQSTEGITRSGPAGVTDARQDLSQFSVGRPEKFEAAIWLGEIG